MTLNLTPNTEALVSAFLRDQPEVQTLADDRCYTVIPKAATYPLLRVTLLIDQPAGGGNVFAFRPAERSMLYAWTPIEALAG